jgi:hypothetical protein
LVDLTEPIKPNFPPGFGGYKFDPALGLGSNDLLIGFFELKPDQQTALIGRSGGQIPARYALSPEDKPTTPGVAEAPPPLATPVEARPAEAAVITTQQVIEQEAESLHTKAQWQLATMGHESARLFWRLRSLRGWSHEESHEVSAGAA